MALPTAIPAAPSTLGAAGNDAQSEYFAALQKTLDALEARANQGTNWWQVAGALLSPGRTGNFGEAVGNVANVLGQQQQQQLDQQIPIAQARAQIAGQKYEVENQAKAIQLLSQAIGAPPQVVTQQLQNGTLSPQAIANIPPAVYAQIATLSPKVGEVVKNIADMSNKNATLNLDQQKFDLEKDRFKETQTQNQISNAREDLKSGMGIADLIAKYGPSIVNMINANKPVSTPPPAPAPSAPPPSAPPSSSSQLPPFPPPPNMPPAVPTPVAPPGDAKGAPMPSMPAAKPPVLNMTPPQPATKVPLANQPSVAPKKSNLSKFSATDAASTIDDLSGLPLATQVEVSKDRMKEADKVWQAKRDEIFQYTPQTMQASNTNLRQLDYYATKFPNMFALMQQQGTIAALQQAAQDGITLQAGQFNARIGLNVRDFLQKVKLNPQEQQAARDVARILGSEFLTNVKTNRGLLGVNPTDNDARLLQAPMASIDDSAKAVQFWARNQLLLNKQREALYNGLQQHTQQAGTSASPGAFFRPGSIYEKINNDYADYRMKLFNQFNPR